MFLKVPCVFIWIYMHVVSMFWFCAVPWLSVVYVVFPAYTLSFYSKPLKEWDFVTYYNIYFVGSVEVSEKWIKLVYLKKYAFLCYYIYMRAILDAILIFSKCSRMTECHQLDKWCTGSQLPKNIKTFCMPRT